MMSQPFPPYKRRQPLPTPPDKLVDRHPTVFIGIQPREDFFHDDLAFGFHGGGFCRLAGRGEVGGVVETVDGFDLGDGEVVVTVEVVQAANDRG